MDNGLRDEVQNKVLSTTKNNIVLEVATGFGKSYIAIRKIAQLHTSTSKILIVVPRNVLIDNWKQEFIKWHYQPLLPLITFTTYVSLPKHAGKWDIICFDECFKGTTEVLTERGFIPFKDLLETDTVAQYKEDGSIEFVKPIRLIKRWHNDKICNWTLRTGKCSKHVYLTPHHNQPYRTKSIKDVRVKEIQDLNFNYLTEIPVSGYNNSEESHLTVLDRIAIAIQADGTLQRHQRKESVYSIQIRRDRKKERLLALLKEYGNFTEINAGRPDYARYMIKLPSGDYKHLNNRFSVNMDKVKAEEFIQEIIQWDGSKLEGNSLYYSSKFKDNSDLVAAIAVQAGYKVMCCIEEDHRKENYSPMYRVYMRKKEFTGTQNMTKTYEDYNDFVYCVEVPSHMIVVRSEGYVFISGNCHHLSERCQEALEHFEVKHSLFLSATLKREHKEFIREWCKEDVEFINVSTKKAIDNDVLPDPKILLIPLELDNKKQECVWYPKEAWKNLPPSKVATFDYKDKWKAKKIKKTPYVLKCTQRQYYNELSGLVDWYKRKNYNPAMKNIWLHKCGQRLQWLSMNKLPFTMKIIKKVHSRFIVFCNTIAESQALRIPAVNSQIGFRNLDRFNSKEINSLVAVNCLNEGCNLVDCKVGIFNAINSSEVMQVQKVGRELRHKAPVIIIPFFKDTREEEIVDKWMQNFDKSLISTKTIDEL